MVKNKEHFLKELALADELRENLLALVFAFNPDIDISKREKFADNIFPFYQRYKPIDRERIVTDTTELQNLDQWMGRDLRIRNIRLKNVRGFPENGKPYGISFLNERKDPQSMIILGGNGFGKSSVFGSLEYVFCKRVGEAQLRTKMELADDHEAYRRFLTHFANDFSDAHCTVETVNDSFTLQGINIPEEVRNKINPQTHFISDCDIYDFCKLNYDSGSEDSFHNLVAQSLGLKDLLDFERHLKTFINYRRITESNKIRAFETSIQQDEALILTNERAILQKQESIKEINRDNALIKPQVLPKAAEILPKLKLRSFEFKNEFSTLQDFIQQFRNAYRQLLALSDQSSTISQAQFLKLGLELAKTSDDCPLCNSSKKPKEDLIRYLEEKLREIESFNNANHEVTRTFNAVKDRLEVINNALALLRTNLQREFEEIRELIELSDLTAKHSEMLLVLNTQMVHEFFVMITTTKENPRFIANPFEYFDSVFDISSEFINNNLQNLFRDLAAYNDERNQIIKAAEAIILSKQTVSTANEQLAVLKSEVAVLVKQNDSLRTKIEDNRSEVLSLRLAISQFNKVKDDAREFFTVYHNKLGKEVQSAFQPIQKIVTEVLNQYLHNDNRNIELKVETVPEETDAETGEILSEIIIANVISKDKPGEYFKVNKYFNTFHYRLFATMVGISVAIASRINTRINMPLVLDDIFYASDFENRTSIESFLENVFDTFEHFTTDMPLQLIMFTHDQLIFESVIHLKQKAPDSIAFAKMFSYKDAKEKEEYMDLIYKYPYHLPKTILNNLINSYVA